VGFLVGFIVFFNVFFLTSDTLRWVQLHKHWK